VVNEQGELLAFRLTPGNTDDRTPVPELTKGLVGKLFGDKGYISQKLFNTLRARPAVDHLASQEHEKQALASDR
jgi:hypothetical protein